MAKKYGNYLAVEGHQLKSKMPANGRGYFVEFDPHSMYVINIHTKTVVGKYAQDHLAYACAEFLDKADQLKLSNEMDKLLRE